MVEEKREYVFRFTVFQRLQHITMFLAIFLLVFTGMPLKYPRAWWSIKIVNLVGGLGNRALLHRIAGVTLIGIGIIHIIYFLFIERKNPLKRDIMLQPKDISDVIQSIKYQFRLADKLPPMGRYTWGEKIEYWAAAWGLALISATGLMMWFKEISLQFIPLPIYQLGEMLHSYEALLAILTVFFGHWYTVHYNPEVFPASLQFLHGMIPMEEMEEFHPLELEKIRKESPHLIAHETPFPWLQNLVYAVNQRLWYLGILIFLLFIAVTAIAFVNLVKHWFLGII